MADRKPAHASLETFNLWMTTCHPESGEACAGDVVRVPAEIIEDTVLLDLGEVRRIDAWGAALLNEAVRRIVARGRNVVLLAVKGDIRRALEQASPEHSLRISSTEERNAETDHELLIARTS